jgi:type VI secretion system secreted protein VgrG
MSVPEIVKKVISDYGFDGDLIQRQTGTYQKRVYCTQYRESDLDFLTRLLA